MRLECPGDERGEAAGFLLQIMDGLQMVDAVFKFFTHAKHHGRGGAHAKLVRGAVHVEPVFGQALQTGNAVADFIVQNFSAAAGDGIEAGIAHASNRIANGEAAVLGDSDNFRRGIAMQMNFETLFDSAQHFFVPVNFEIGMQAALHKHPGAA